MIFDRTIEDVESAKKIREEKIQKNINLSAEEIEILEKGTMTINTLNRIEQKQNVLKGLFEDMGYYNINIKTKSWDEYQIFDENSFKKIIENIKILRDAFFVYSDTPKTPTISYNYKDINSLEKILHDLDLMINDIKSGRSGRNSYIIRT